MHQFLRDTRGWASAELALLTPAVVFLGFLLGAVVATAGDRAQLVVATHDAALSVMRGESAASIREVAGADLSAVRVAKVNIDRRTINGRTVMQVCIVGERALPTPLHMLSMRWQECASAGAEP